MESLASADELGLQLLDGHAAQVLIGHERL